MSARDDASTWNWLTNHTTDVEDERGEGPDVHAEEWVATFDEPRPTQASEVTFQPTDVDVEKLASEWITVELGTGAICYTEDYR